jgi:hypothetical protein
MGQSDIPSACFECGSEDIEPADDKSEKSQFVCLDCGLVMNNQTSSKSDTGVDWREKDGSKSSNQTDHTIYEEEKVWKKVRLEYMESDDSLEKVDQEYVPLQGVVNSSLYCECGDVFESWEAAVDHIREYRP